MIPYSNSLIAISMYNQDMDKNEKGFDQFQEVMEIDGTGTLIIKNTGGSSAAEGGMGSDSGDEKQKGELHSLDHDEKQNDLGMNDPDSFDPLKKDAIEETKAKE